MRAREFLFEDNRSKIEKLKALIDHSSTEDTVRDVARGRLKLLMASQCPVEAPQRITITTNITEKDLDREFLVGLNLGQIYNSLCALEPAPVEIYFLRQGSIRLTVLPPFMNKTKQEYLNEILQACPGAKQIQNQMIEGYGYMFSVIYL